MAPPASYEPGASYPLRVVLARAGMTRGGFELASRGGCSGLQIGTLASVDGRTHITEEGGIAYLHHIREGTSLSGPDSVVWRFTWTAPSEAGPPVVLSVAANAADGDASQLGDHIYTHSPRIGPSSPTGDQ